MSAPFGLPAELAELQADYEVLGELGRGGAAVVYRARDRALGRDVAVKVVHPRPTSPDDDPVSRLAREARMVAQLQHPNIVAVYAVRRLHGGGLALIMQLVAGGTLKSAVQADGPLPPDRVEGVLRDVAAALAYAHARGLVHRDVKPENIFLDEETGRALLADFGIARSTESDSMTMTGTAVGTPFYMSPEQVDGGVVDGRSDLYSLGLAAWEALTGRRPWDGESLYNVIYKQKFEELPPVEALRPGVPRRLQYVVERMLQKRPGARWAGADGLLAQLDHPILPGDYTRWQRALAGRVERFREAEAERAAERAASPTEALVSASTVQFSPGSIPDRTAPPAPVLGSTTASGPAASRPWVPGPVAGVTAGTVAPPRLAPPPSDVELPQPGTTVDLRATPASPALASGADGAPRLPQYVDTVEPSWDERRPPSAQRRGRRLRRSVLATALVGVAGAGWLGASGRLTMPGAATGWLREAGVDLGQPTVAQAFTPAGAAVPVAATVNATGPTRPANGPGFLPPGQALLAAGGRHSCALTLAGRAHCWGANERGQLGDGGPALSRAIPVAVTGVLSFAALTGGFAHSCAVTRLGDVYCWGSNTRGQLGDATTTRRNAPVRIAGPGAYAAVAAGFAHTCALTTDGVVRCWGDNAQGQAGAGPREPQPVPSSVRVGSAVVQVAAGGQHSCAVTDAGRLVCWGSNADGQLGGPPGPGSPTPQPVSLPGRVTSVGLGLAHSCAVTDDGALWCWGRNDAGQLGDGTRLSRAQPVRVPLGDGRRAAGVISGAAHTCAIDTDGGLACWGRNTRGAVGDGSVASRSVPVATRLPSPVVAAAAGTGHTCAVTVSAGTLCWGDDTDGQLGDASVTSRTLPGPVRYPAGVVARTRANAVASN